MEMTLQEYESKLYDEFDKFTSKPGDTIYSYHWRYAKLINNMNISGMTMKKIQVYKVCESSLAIVESHDAKEVREMKHRYPYQLALLDNNYNPPPSYISSRSQYTSSANYHPHQPYQTTQSYQAITPSNKQQIIQSPPQLSYDPPAVQQQQPAQSTHLDSGFVVLSFLPTVDPIASLDKAMLFLITAMNLKFPPTNNQLGTS
ncbi:hypothetical protein Tco_0281746 [Tanacetum coccineum]